MFVTISGITIKDWKNVNFIFVCIVAGCAPAELQGGIFCLKSKIPIHIWDYLEYSKMRVKSQAILVDF